MKTNFPEIRHIDDVLPHIADRDEFIVARKDGYIVVNYAISLPDTFFHENPLTQAIRRECRGLVFDNNGNILSRRLHKFHNYKENEETQPHNVDFSLPHIILDKRDGSMITPLVIHGKLQWGTKMGITETSEQATRYVQDSSILYEKFAWYCHKNSLTPIFEWTSPHNRIVVDYKDEALTLLAIRGTVTGRYLSLEECRRKISGTNIPVVDTYENTTIDQVREWKDREGIVIAFDSGYRLKIKADLYCLQHKSKDAITREKNVLQYIVNDTVDDVMPFLHGDDRDKLLDFQTKFHSTISDISKRMTDQVNELWEKSDKDRKTFATQYVKQLDPVVRKIAFKLIEGKECRDVVIELLSKNIGTQTKIENIRKTLLGGLKWDYTLKVDLDG